MKTYQPKKNDVNRAWRLFDAQSNSLGRVASDIAKVLIGKDKAFYSPNIDVGDYVVVVNAEKVKLTGRKLSDKKYYSHSGYPGGFKEISIGEMLEKHPERVMLKAVSGMLPDNKLKKERLKRLKIVVGEKNPYPDKFKILNPKS